MDIIMNRRLLFYFLGITLSIVPTVYGVSFTDVTYNSGVGDLTSDAVLIADLDGDGWPDILTCNKYGSGKFFRNESSGTRTIIFKDITNSSNLSGIKSSGGVIGDVDSDGDLDIFFANERGDSRLYLNYGRKGTPTFTNRTEEANLGSITATGATLGDIDNDGDLDILVYYVGEAMVHSFGMEDDGGKDLNAFPPISQQSLSSTNQRNTTQFPSIPPKSAIRNPKSAIQNPLLDIQSTLSNGRVTPEIGTIATIFYYYVDCSAGTPSLHIDDDATGKLMTHDFRQTYSYFTTLSHGTHTYYFTYGESRLPEIDQYKGPDVLRLYNGYVSPISGGTHTTFTYSVYCASSIPKLYIDGATYTMTYDNGIRYTYSKELTIGTHTYYFYDETNQIYLPDTAPAIPYQGPDVSWLFNGTVTPSEGYLSEEFFYCVETTLGTTAKVYLYVDTGSYTMNLLNIRGSITTYTYSQKHQPGTHSYYFWEEINNVYLPLSGTSSPYLSPYVTTLINGTVTPAYGTSGTEFTYRVTCPFAPYFYIDGLSHQMSYDNGDYSYKGTLTGGTHSYYFHNTQYDQYLPITAPSIPYSGPLVNPLSMGTVTPAYGIKTTYTYYVNSLVGTPILWIDGIEYSMAPDEGDRFKYATDTLSYGSHTYWFYEPQTNLFLPDGGSSTPYKGPIVTPLSNGSVTPTYGTSGTQFVYSLHCFSGTSEVYIDGTSYSMTYASGTTYLYSTSLSYGSHSYFFYEKDSQTYFPDGAPQQPIIGPAVTPLSEGRVMPECGSISTIFTYYVKTAGGPPSVYIDGKKYYNMQLGTGTNYYYSTQLSAGTHTYAFYDPTYRTYLPSNGLVDPYYGPWVSFLSNGYVQPTAGSTETLFTYYVDCINNDPQVYIDGIAYVMNYVSKLTYSYTTSLLMGTHTYYFYDSNSGTYLPQTAPEETYSGPDVGFLSEGYVLPQCGSGNTTFVYYVNSIAGTPSVIIDNSLPIIMEQESETTYVYSTALSYGTHTYSFTINETYLPSTSPFIGPYVTPLANGTVTPLVGSEFTIFTYVVDSMEGDTPSVYIDEVLHQMDYATGTTYEYTMTLPIGSHTYYFYEDTHHTRFPWEVSQKGPRVVRPQSTIKLYENNGTGSFSDITDELGIGTITVSDAALVDLDNDGLVDIYLARGVDNLSPVVYKNLGGKKFVEVSAEAKLNEYSHAQAVTFGDINSDTHPEIFIATAGEADNLLYKNSGSWTFTKITNDAHVALPRSAEGCTFGDVDLDGSLDLYVSSSSDSNILYQNDGKGQFTDITAGTGINYKRNYASGVVWVDLDGDGDLDLFVCDTYIYGRSKVYQNDLPPGNWLKVRLLGTKNTYGIGAKVSIYNMDKELIGYRQIITPSDGHQCMGPIEAHFGIPTTGTYSLEVTFPSGVIITSTVTTNQVIIINELGTQSLGPEGVTNFSAEGRDTEVILTWSNPTSYTGILIIRNVGSYSLTSKDGTSTYNGTGTTYTDTQLINGETYYYTAFVYDAQGYYSSPAFATATTKEILPENPFNAIVYPNPFRKAQHSHIYFDDLPEHVKIKIYKITGQLVAELEGSGKIEWDVTNQSGKYLASGVYIYLIVDNFGRQSIGKLAVIK